MPKFKKGNIPFYKGKSLPEEVKLKISQKAKERYKFKKYRKMLARAGRRGIKIKLANKKKLYKKCEFCKSQYYAGWKENKHSYTRRFCSKKCVYAHSRFDKKRIR